MYKVELTSEAKKDFKNLKKKKGRIALAFTIEEFKTSPDLGKKLRDDLRGKWSIRINGYRIIYVVNKKEKLVTILKIKQRAAVYN